MEPNVIDKDIILSTLYLAFALKIFVFILGFFTIGMGYKLIRDGVKGNFNFTTDIKGMKGALQSSSPGLLFVLLGVGLIAYAMFVKKGADLQETATPVQPQQEINATDAQNTEGNDGINLDAIDTSMNVHQL